MGHQFILKVITYNIHSGKNFWMVPKLPSMIDYLTRQNADIIAIQEINENRKRGYQFSQFLQSLQLDGHFAPNVEIRNGAYGVATFSRHPIVGIKHLFLPSEREQRGVLDLTIQFGSQPLHVLNTHLGLSKSERKNQINKIANHLQSLQTPYLLVGDFNSSNLSLEKWGCFDTAKENGDSLHPTTMFSSHRIDYIFHSSEIKKVNYHVDRIPLSDHYPIIATFKLL